MRVFVTGATGFIGRALILRLLGGGHQVSALVRSEVSAQNQLGPEVRLLPANAGAGELRETLGGCEAIINLAGEPILGGRWNLGRRRTITESRLATTARIVAAINEASPRPRVLISASAVGYYGDCGDEPVDETSPPGRGFIADLCGDWEAQAHQAEASGARVFIPRLGIVLGPEGGALRQMLTPFQFYAGGPLGSGRQFMPWIHLHDLVELLATALEDERYRGAAIAAAPNPIRNRDFARALGQTLGRPSLLLVPAVVLHVLLGEAATVLLGGQRVMPRVLEGLGFRWRFDDLIAALRDILVENGPEITVLGPTSLRPLLSPESHYLQQRPASYLLRHTTAVKAPLAEVFAFFAQPWNLGVMTPSAMRFRIVGEPPRMSRGLQIDYSLQVSGLPLRWRTRIEEWRPNELFIDSQERGPYQSWWHEHHFRAAGAETVVEDRLYYAPPLGAAGHMLNSLFVGPELSRIFRFRAHAMRFRFPGASEASGLDQTHDPRDVL
jgi:uncharacterized protein